MKINILTIAGVFCVVLSLVSSETNAGYMQPGESIGVSLNSPLPEGVFVADTEDYGKNDTSNTRLGVNIPIVIWSTPWTYRNTRLEILAAVPFGHLDGKINQIGFLTSAFGPILAHDFGNGLTGGVAAFVHTPDPSANIRAISARRTTEGDFRESLQYTIPAGGMFGGLTLIENGSITTGFGQPGIVEGENDFFAGDFAVEKTFGKLTLGFVGFGNIDINNNARNATGGGRTHNLELGGLVGYDFGKFSLTAFVTRGVLKDGFTPGVTTAVGYETRGWLRVIVPLYVAPAASVIQARY